MSKTHIYCRLLCVVTSSVASSLLRNDDVSNRRASNAYSDALLFLPSSVEYDPKEADDGDGATDDDDEVGELLWFSTELKFLTKARWIKGILKLSDPILNWAMDVGLLNWNFSRQRVLNCVVLISYMFTSSAARLRNISDCTERSVIRGSWTERHRLSGSDSFSCLLRKDGSDWKSGVDTTGSSEWADTAWSWINRCSKVNIAALLSILSVLVALIRRASSDMQIVAYFELSFSPMLDCSSSLLQLLLLLLGRIALGAAVELGGGTILSAIASEALYSLWRTSIHPSGKVRTVHTYKHTKITNIFRKKKKIPYQHRFGRH